jgi:hypothetical protein
MLRRSGLLLGLLAMAGPAAAGSIAIDDPTGADNFDRQLGALMTSYEAEAATYLGRVDASGESFQLWYNPVEERDLLFGRQGYSGSDADWARANLRIYDLYEQLGGNEIGLRQTFGYRNDQFYVALDGVGGQWFDASEKAHGFLLKMLIGRSVELPQDVKEAIAGLASNDLDAVLGTARNTLSSNRAFLSRGRSTQAVLSGDFDDSLGTPVVQAPPGVYVDGASLDGDGRLTVTLRTTGEAELGPGELLLFNAGRSIIPVDRFGIFVVDGPGTAAPPADDHGDSTAAATPLAGVETLDGHIETDGDVDVFAVTVAVGGDLSVRSTGGSDLVGTILDGDGDALDSDDDGGDWYNFRLVRNLAPGTYYVRVRHCCGGTGAYRVSASFSPSS